MRLEHRYDRLWERLLQVLDTLGEVDSSTPGRLRLTVEGHRVEIVMSEREWSDLVRTINGSFVPAAAQVLQAVTRAQMERSHYLVHDMYELHACATPDQPVQAEMEAERLRVEEYLRQHPDARPEWRANRPGEEPT